MKERIESFIRYWIPRMDSEDFAPIKAFFSVQWSDDIQWQLVVASNSHGGITDRMDCQVDSFDVAIYKFILNH